jgi:hypothetical protein
MSHLLQSLEIQLADPRHVFWEDSVSLCSPQFVPRSLLKGHQQITDAYLLSLVIAHQSVLVTFDTAIPVLAKDCGHPQAVLLLHH